MGKRVKKKRNLRFNKDLLVTLVAVVVLIGLYVGVSYLLIGNSEDRIMRSPEEVLLSPTSCAENQTIMKLDNETNAGVTAWNSGESYAVCYSDIFGEDYLGNDSHECDARIVSQQEIDDEEIHLVSGWNAITPKTKTLTLEQIEAGGCVLNYDIWTWENDGVNTASYDYIGEGPLLGGIGYWAWIESGCVVSASGERYLNKTVNLKKGWNSVGVGIDTPINDLFVTTDGCEPLWENSWYWDGQSTYLQIENNLFVAGKGYWILCEGVGGDMAYGPVQKSFPINQPSNSVLWLDNAKVSGDRITNNFENALCYGDLSCSAKEECATGEYVVVSLNNDSNANVSSRKSKEVLKLCCSSAQASPCAPNWTAFNTTCDATETYSFWYEDLNYCGTSVGRLEGDTPVCDFDNNGVLGSFSDFSESQTNLTVYVSSARANDTKIYNGTKTVEFIEGSVVRVEFDYNFSKTPLDTEAISIKKQTNSSDYGYVLVNGLSGKSKTVRVDKLSGSSNKVCIKDAHVSSVSSFSSGCIRSNEYLLTCPGNNSDFSCNVSSNLFIVSGLTHSGVKEYLSGSNNADDDCDPSWNCTAWSSCTGGKQIKSCVDINSCGVTTGRPSLEKSCSSGPSEDCVPIWDCGKWGECKDGEKTKVCEDTNNCLDDKTEKEDCGEGIPLWGWIMIVVLIIAIIVTVILIVYFGKKKSGAGNLNGGGPDDLNFIGQNPQQPQNLAPNNGQDMTGYGNIPGNPYS
jgi:hypothetical protein